MAKIAVQNLKGEKTGEIDLASDVFEVKKKDSLVSRVYLAIRSNFRNAIAHTKNRSARAGSTKKPWKQKGTGRARTGSVRNPIWRKGGIIFGPTNERNFSKKINKKEKLQAMRMVLSGKLKDEEIVVVDSWEMEEAKTKRMAEALKNLKIGKSALAVFGKEEKDAKRIAKNISFTQTVSPESLNALDLLDNKFVVLSKQIVKLLEEKYSPKAQKKAGQKSDPAKNENGENIKAPKETAKQANN